MAHRRAVLARDIDDGLLAGLSSPSRQLLLQLLIYKAIFLGNGFRTLSEEQPDEVGEVLARIHRDSAAEAAGLALAVREWDAHPAAGEGLGAAAADARKRLLEDVLALKEGVVDVGLAAAMRAPTEQLRRRFTVLADVDRRHADALRRLLGSRTVADHLDGDGASEPGDASGVGIGRPEGGTLRRRVQEAVDQARRRGAEPAVIVFSPESFRHARDEGFVDPGTGRAMAIPVEVDMGWRGECFAVETLDRIAYAELITARSAAEGDEPRDESSRSPPA